MSVHVIVRLAGVIIYKIGFIDLYIQIFFKKCPLPVTVWDQLWISLERDFFNALKNAVILFPYFVCSFLFNKSLRF